MMQYKTSVIIESTTAFLLRLCFIPIWNKNDRKENYEDTKNVKLTVLVVDTIRPSEHMNEHNSELKTLQFRFYCEPLGF